MTILSNQIMLFMIRLIINKLILRNETIPRESLPFLAHHGLFQPRDEDK